MIESLADKAIASLLATIDGLKVVVGMEDNTPALEAPYCVVWSRVERVAGKSAVYELLTTIEYVSITGPDTVAAVESAMTAIDAALNTQPSSGVLATLQTTNLGYLAWEHIPRTQQDVGDRRRNIRELQVFAQAA